ncbi:zinc ABC transporter substrate-binding protein [uncultured Paracoccus sp.]|uniref:zinc ABC transporter substrate-binding protein n=1 Tax=uncultured Paracoccus sp. TaxID=189685 RepID=UPI0025CD0875|nr:zinc ABC transporter substrate-binding protein [uncultured Paracoccus sp.]
MTISDLALGLALGLPVAAAGPVAAQPPRIVVDTPITASLVQQVTGDLAPVQVLLPKGADAHHHQMRPSDAQGLQDAGLLVWTGPQLTPWLDRAATTVAADIPQLRLLEVPGTHLRAYAEEHGHDEGEGHDDDHGQDNGHDHDHDHEHDHDDEHGHDHDHDHAGTDPHAWLDPANAQLWVTAIAEVLAQADPDNAEAYRGNAVAASGRIGDLDAAMQAQLAPHRDASIVVFHDAYGYFTDHFGLRPAIAVSLGDASTPSAARLQGIKGQIADTGAACAFPEYGGDPRLVQSVIDGTPVRMGNELSPEGGILDGGTELYSNVLSGLAEAISDCLDGR